MQKQKSRLWILTAGIVTAVFVVFTVVVASVDVQSDGVQQIGCATVNFWWRDLIGVSNVWHLISDIIVGLTLVALASFLVWQLVLICRARSWRALTLPWWVFDIVLVVLGLCYLFFQIVVVNCRPILIGNVAETSYPSSHILLIITLWPAIITTLKRTLSQRVWCRVITVLGIAMMTIGVVARTLCGYHWLTDIIGGILLGATLTCWHQSAIQRD